jgi:hypothetical protein
MSLNIFTILLFLSCTIIVSNLFEKQLRILPDLTSMTYYVMSESPLIQFPEGLYGQSQIDLDRVKNGNKIHGPFGLSGPTRFDDRFVRPGGQTGSVGPGQKTG